MGKITTEQFIQKARLLYGDQHDYSKVNYIDSKTKVCIICRKHQIEFWKTPNAYLSKKQGCPECSKERSSLKRRKTTQQFIEEAKKIHGEKYDYSKVIYVTNKSKVHIICPIHGDFEQSPSNHLKGEGCPKCANKNITTEEFIEKAKEIHGNKYDYSKVTYYKNDKKVCIICPTHGEFWQTPSSHLCGSGCPQCGKERTTESKKLSTEIFIQKAREIHGDKYNYDKVNYINSTTKVCIVCPEHGEFWQQPDNHLQKQGCPYCKQSRLETSIYTLLQKNNMVFETQKSFSWLKNTSTNFPLYLDFYLPTFNLAIECQGQQHFTPVTYFDGIEGFQKTLERDKLKLSLCTEHNIKILYYVNDTINVPQNWELYPVIKTKNELLNNIKIF